MIIYADVTFINNFLMTVAIIWAIGKIMEIQYKWKNLLLGGITANIYLLLALSLYSINGVIKLILHIILNLLSAFIIVKISFPGLSNSRFIKVVFYFYLITFITIGTTISLIYIVGASPFTVRIQKLFIGIIVLLFIGNYGWKIFRRYRAPEEFLLPLRIQFMNKFIELTGLLDTGNSLTDPLTQVPVVVVNLDALSKLFSEQLQRELMCSGKSSVELIEVFNANKLPERVRILPFSDLGQENGLLIGFRPDFIEIVYQDKVIKKKNSIIAISNRKLDYDDEYQALIHPQLLQF